MPSVLLKIEECSTAFGENFKD